MSLMKVGSSPPPTFVLGAESDAAVVGRRIGAEAPLGQRDLLALRGGERCEPVEAVRLGQVRSSICAAMPANVPQALVVEIEADLVDVGVARVVVGEIPHALVTRRRVPLEGEVLARHRSHGVHDLLPVGDEGGGLPVGGPGEPPAVEFPTRTNDGAALPGRHHVLGQLQEVGVVGPRRPLAQAGPGNWAAWAGPRSWCNPNPSRPTCTTARCRPARTTNPRPRSPWRTSAVCRWRDRMS